MPVERRGAGHLSSGRPATGGAHILGKAAAFEGGTSRMTRECQVRICERLGVKFPGPTWHEFATARPSQSCSLKVRAFLNPPDAAGLCNSRPFFPLFNQTSLT